MRLNGLWLDFGEACLTTSLTIYGDEKKSEPQDLLPVSSELFRSSSCGPIHCLQKATTKSQSHGDLWCAGRGRRCRHRRSRSPRWQTSLHRHAGVKSPFPTPLLHLPSPPTLVTRHHHGTGGGAVTYPRGQERESVQVSRVKCRNEPPH